MKTRLIVTAVAVLILFVSFSVVSAQPMRRGMGPRLGMGPGPALEKFLNGRACESLIKKK